MYILCLLVLLLVLLRLYKSQHCNVVSFIIDKEMDEKGGKAGLTMMADCVLRPILNIVLLPCRSKLIELKSTSAQRLKPSRAIAV